MSVKAVCEADLPPARRVSADCSIESPADLVAAFEELSWLRSRRRTEEAKLAAQIALLRWQSEREQRLSIDGRPVSFAQRLKSLQSAVREYGREHPGELLLAALIEGLERAARAGAVR